MKTNNKYSDDEDDYSQIMGPEIDPEEEDDDDWDMDDEPDDDEIDDDDDY